ncbi:hypothetical protein BG006_003033 [Podila minutissima]|uniref:Uncharacterized protein n=1 Tax=Podila minutissima TaxID=64525 RepID=A0A9P5SNM9_9FUNG|nr:hypothetical protein BG006_003033 [Podila minutissima]
MVGPNMLARTYITYAAVAALALVSMTSAAPVTPIIPGPDDLDLIPGSEAYFAWCCVQNAAACCVKK